MRRLPFDKSTKKYIWIIVALLVGIALASVALICLPAQGQIPTEAEEGTEKRTMYWPVCQSVISAASSAAEGGLRCESFILPDEPTTYRIAPYTRDVFWEGIVTPSMEEGEEKARTSACAPLNEGQRARLEEAQTMLLGFPSPSMRLELPRGTLFENWLRTVLRDIEPWPPSHPWGYNICVREDSVGEHRHITYDPQSKQIQIPSDVFEGDVSALAATMMHGATLVAFYENWHHLLGGWYYDAVQAATQCADARWVIDHTIEAIALLNERLWSLENRFTWNRAELELWLEAFDAASGDRAKLHALAREGLLLRQEQRSSDTSPETVCGPVPPTPNWHDRRAFVSPAERAMITNNSPFVNGILRDILRLATVD